ncbi:MAG: ribosome silencing factor [Desulfovibrionaceae bacterium]|nr:ribosome silencing factor [Desulfovibrionaceae bacterium]
MSDFETLPELDSSSIAPKKKKFSTAPAGEKAEVIRLWLEENKAADITVLDVSERSSCMERMIVVTAMSQRHGRSLADGVLKLAGEQNYEFLRMEGYRTGEWILLDMNDIVVHVFQAEVRELYRLESLWQGLGISRKQEAE